MSCPTWKILSQFEAGSMDTISHCPSRPWKLSFPSLAITVLGLNQEIWFFSLDLTHCGCH